MISYVLKNDRYEMKVPALTFGAAGFERNDCDDVYFEFLDKYVELGGWCIDTARVYCDWLENGHDSSEGVIGRWLKARNNRDKICIATKGGHPEMGHMDESRLSREELTKDLDKTKPIFVLSHEPDELQKTADAGADIDFSGHTHDGQLFPGNLTIGLFWENPCGMIKKDNMYSIVTSGVGVYGTFMRVGTDAEICSVDIDFAG